MGVGSLLKTAITILREPQQTLLGDARTSLVDLPTLATDLRQTGGQAELGRGHSSGACRHCSLSDQAKPRAEEPGRLERAA